MNRRPPTPSPDPRPVDERDWLAQERVLARPGDDRRAALLAQALRTQPVTQPPAGFAAAVARLAAEGAGARVAAEEGARLEPLLVNVLLVLMALAAAGVVALWGRQWLALAGEVVGAQATTWGLLAAACLLLSWLPAGARRLYEATRALQVG